jgi:hypothetical protein
MIDNTVTEDKRKSKRFAIDLSARYLLGGSSQEWKGCSIINTSHDGLGIEVYLKEKIHLGTTLRMEITVPTKETPIKSIGILMWIKELKEEMDFVGGVKLTRIDSEDKWTLMDYAYDNWSGKEQG